MSDNQLPQNSDLDELNSTLNDGLRTCRSMIANYRSLLAPDQLMVETAANDTGEDDLEAGASGE